LEVSQQLLPFLYGFERVLHVLLHVRVGHEGVIHIWRELLDLAKGTGSRKEEKGGKIQRVEKKWEKWQDIMSLCDWKGKGGGKSAGRGE